MTTPEQGEAVNHTHDRFLVTCSCGWKRAALPPSSPSQNVSVTMPPDPTTEPRTNTLPDFGQQLVAKGGRIHPDVERAILAGGGWDGPVPEPLSIGEEVRRLIRRLVRRDPT